MTTKKQLKELVTSFLNTNFVNDSKSDYGSLANTMFYSDYPEHDSKYNNEFDYEVLAKAAELGLTVEFEDSHGGEGEGDQYWSVYSFTKDNQTVHVKFNGWYASHYGSEFTEWFFVKPKQVTVTQFVQE